MKFTIYGRFVLEIIRENDQWTAFRSGNDTRRRETELVIPADLDASEMETFLDNIYHELARSGQTIHRLD